MFISNSVYISARFGERLMNDEEACERRRWLEERSDGGMSAAVLYIRWPALMFVSLLVFTHYRCLE